jgi:GT2 family glycosyltransferase
MIGAFMMIRRSLLVEIGMLDTRFFMYAEDVDLCFRVRRSNRKIVFDSSRSLVHLGGTSSQQRWNDRQRIDTVRHSLFLMQCKHFGKAVASCSLVCRYLYSTIRLLQIRLVTSSPETRAIYESDAAANARLLGRLPEILRSASVKGS